MGLSQRNKSHEVGNGSYSLPEQQYSNKSTVMSRDCKVENSSCELPSLSKTVQMNNEILDFALYNNGEMASDIISNTNCSNNSSLKRMMSDSSADEERQCKRNSKSAVLETRRVRFIRKSGHCNVSHSNLSDKPRRFIADIFTTGVDLQWRWNLFVFSAAFIISWIGFGLIFWLVSYIHGDFELENVNSTTFKPCVNNLNRKSPFTSSFLFSLETQTTIGYGFRVVTEECSVSILFVVIQSVFGCILDAFMIGLIMAKISRPKKRAETLMFSDNGVINMRDGKLCFMIRIGNLRKSHLVEATIRMQFIHSRETIEGEFIPLEQIDLHLDLKNDSDRLFLVTPQTICHPIDESSPLWDLAPEDLENSHFEIIVILEGMVEATGMTTQARASYLPSEILWGHRFHNMVSFSHNNSYKVNFKKFNKTYYTPDVAYRSAKQIYETAQTEMMLKTSVSLRDNTNLDSDSSSTRSSIKSSGQLRSSASDGRDSGYTAVEDLQRSFSLQSLNNDNNKAMTSTTSLSEDSEDEKQKKRHNLKLVSPRPELALSTEQLNLISMENIAASSNRETSLVDPTCTLSNVDEAKNSEVSFPVRNLPNHSSFRSQASQRSDAGHVRLVKSTEDVRLFDASEFSCSETSLSRPEFQSTCENAFDLRNIENEAPLCV